MNDPENPTLEEFKTAGAELLKSLPKLNADQLENGSKCLNLLYLRLSDTDAKMAVALGLLPFFHRKIEKREMELF